MIDKQAERQIRILYPEITRDYKTENKRKYTFFSFDSNLILICQYIHFSRRVQLLLNA